jgi:Flp pilus assembly protein TadD
VWSALGRAQLELGETGPAESNLRHAIILDGSNPYAHNNLGVLLQRLGKREEARQEFKTALGLNPDLEVARKNLDAVGDE